MSSLPQLKQHSYLLRCRSCFYPIHAPRQHDSGHFLPFLPFFLPFFFAFPPSTVAAGRPGGPARAWAGEAGAPPNPGGGGGNPCSCDGAAVAALPTGAPPFIIALTTPVALGARYFPSTTLPFTGGPAGTAGTGAGACRALATGLAVAATPDRCMAGTHVTTQRAARIVRVAAHGTWDFSWRFSAWSRAIWDSSWCTANRRDRHDTPSHSASRNGSERTVVV